MRTLLAVGCLLSLLFIAIGCTDPSLTGQCVAGPPEVNFIDEPQIVPDMSPFRFCPVDPNAPSPNNARRGSIVLQNCGRLSLNIESATITNEGVEVFKDLRLQANDIAAGKSVAADFLYLSQDLLEHSGAIVIKSNAKNYPTLEIGLYVPSAAAAPSNCAPVGLDGGVEDH